MGEAKRKRSNQRGKIERATELRRIFEQLGIDHSRPGFYDDPAFIEHERTTPGFLEAYAEYVLVRERTPEYEAMVHNVVPELSSIINARLIRHNWLGACIAITGSLTRMLDRLGIWNIPMAGSASAYAGAESRHFAIVDENEGAGFDTGHMWIIAPPYDVIDLTLHYQRWRGDEFQRHIPQTILARDAGTVRARAQDVVAPDVRRRYPPDSELHFRLFRDQKRILETFPAKKIVVGSTDIRYVPAGIRVPDGPLEEVNTEARAGVPAIEIWRDDIVPAFGIKE